MDELYIGKVRALQLDRLADSQAAAAGCDLQLWLHAGTGKRVIVGAARRGAQTSDGWVNGVPFTPALDLAGMSTSDAQAKSAVVRCRSGFQDAGNRPRMVDAITHDARTKIVTDGLEDAAVIRAWGGRSYKHYVPLQRDVEEAAGRAAGYNVRGPEAPACYRLSQMRRVNILANVIAQAESVIIRAEKAAVGRSVLDMARQNPNPISGAWTPPTERHIDPNTGLVTTRCRTTRRWTTCSS